MQQLKLFYALKQGVLTHVRDVVSGSKCNCVCPACNEKLIARKGSLRQHHFAHASGSECSYGAETALHLAAKQVLEQRMEIYLPEVEVWFYSPRASYILTPAKMYNLNKVALEKRVGQIIPDVIGYVEGEPLLIEIRVTHKVSYEKAQHIKKLKLSAVEIDLSNTSRELEIKDIESSVIETEKGKKWIFNVEANKKQGETLSKAKVLNTIHRGFALQVDGCPIAARTFHGRPYANVTHDCHGCERLLMIGDNNITCGISR